MQVFCPDLQPNKNPEQNQNQAQAQAEDQQEILNYKEDDKVDN